MTSLIVGVVGFIVTPSLAQRHVGAHAFVIDDGNGNTLTLTYPNSPPVIGNAIYTFAPGGGTSVPSGTINGQTLWWNNSTPAWIADNFLTNTGAAIGIGTPTPGATLDIRHTTTSALGAFGVGTVLGIQPSSPSGNRYYGASIVADAANSSGITGIIEGVRGQASMGETGTSSQPVNELAATVGSAENYSSQTVSSANGLFGQILNGSTGTISNGNALITEIFNLSSGTITNARSIYVPAANNSGTITNLYGIYMDQLTGGTNIWPIFLSDGTANGSIFDVNSAGNVGVGTSTPGAGIDVERTTTVTSSAFGSITQLSIQPSSPSGSRYYGASVVADAANSNAISNNIEGVRGQASIGETGTASQPVSGLIGTVGSAESNSTQTVSTATGVFGQVVSYSSGTMSAANALETGIFNQGSGTITDARGLYVQQASNASGTLTNLYGIYIEPQNAGANDWPIFASDGSGGALFSVTSGGSVGIGTPSPNATLQIVGTVEVGNSIWSRTISNVLGGNFTYSFPTTAAQSSSDISVSLGGPSLTDGQDDVLVEVPNAVMTSVTGCFSAWVSGAHAITVRFNNYSSTSQTPPASTTYYFTIIGH